jgi:DivIVA domain-containing protein
MTEGRLAPEEVRTRTFSRVLRGYRPREVRRLLQRAAADLARLRHGLGAMGPDDQRPLTPEEVEEVRFQPAIGGYEMDEVDNFLDQLVVELELAGREPLRPPSALPAPPLPAPPAATPRPPPMAPTPPPVIPGPAPVPPDPAPMAPGPAPMAPDPAPMAPGPAPMAPGPAPVPPGAAPDRPGAAPHPPDPVPGPPVGERSPTRGREGPAVHSPGPALPDEELFPPPSVPPSAAPPPPPPPPPTPRPPGAAPARPLTPSEVEMRTFDRGAPGYLPAHVDLFLAKAARALAGRDGETLNRWDVLRQRFPLGPRGYATSEVDAFLVRLAAQFPEPDPEAQREILRRLTGGAPESGP